MSRTYRDVLNERGVAPGPWVTFEDRTQCDSDTHPKDGDGEATAPLVSGAVRLRNRPNLRAIK